MRTHGTLNSMGQSDRLAPALQRDEGLIEGHGAAKAGLGMNGSTGNVV